MSIGITLHLDTSAFEAALARAAAAIWCLNRVLRLFRQRHPFWIWWQDVDYVSPFVGRVIARVIMSRLSLYRFG